MRIREEDLRKEVEIALAEKGSQTRCSARLGIRIDSFRRLLRRARIHGVNAVLHSNMPKTYTDEFKLSVVNSVISESLPIAAASAQYNLNKSTVRTWVDKYQDGGEEALLGDGRGRRGMGRKKKPRLEDYEPGSIEYLKLENELLKRENLLLKKALPLVREKIKDRSRGRSDTSSSEN